MKKLLIKSEKHGEKFAYFQTEDEIQKYLSSIGNHWGHLAFVEIIPATEQILDENNNVLVEAQEEQTINHPATVSFSIEDITEQLQAKKESDEAREYLASTDWYVIKWMDTGNDAHYPPEIKAARIAARAKVID